MMRNKSRVVVIAYHSVSDDNSSLSIKPAEFENQIKYLRDKGINIIDLQTYLDALGGKRILKGKNALISFDDGYKDIYTNALPILKKYNAPAVMFINSALLGSSALFATKDYDRMRHICSLQELKELAGNGVAIANHGAHHESLTYLTGQKIEREFTECSDWISTNININAFPNIFALPKGDGDERVKNILLKAGAEHIMGERIDVYPNRSISYFGASINPVFRWIRNNKKLLYVISIIVLVKILLGILILSNAPNVNLPLNYYVASGGDDTSYIESAGEIVKGNWFATTNLVGYPTFVAFIMLLTGANSLPEIAAPLVFSNVFIFSILALIATLLMTYHFWKKISYVILAGIIFLGIPYVWMLFMNNFVLVGIYDGGIDLIGWRRTLHLFGLMVIGDWFSFALTSWGFFLFLKERYIWAGALLGLSFIIRAQNIFLSVFLAMGLLLLKKFKKFFAFSISAFVFGCFQLISNYKLTGSIFKFAGYTPENNIDSELHGVGIKNLLSIFPRLVHYLPFAIPVLIAGLIILIIALKYFWHSKEKFYFLIATGVLSPFMLLLTYPAIRNPRYFLPFIPIFIIFALAGWEFLFRRSRHVQI